MGQIKKLASTDVRFGSHELSRRQLLDVHKDRLGVRVRRQRQHQVDLADIRLVDEADETREAYPSPGGVVE